MKRSKHIRNIAYFISILILLLVLVFSGLQILESTVLHQGDEQGDGFVTKTIIKRWRRVFPPSGHYHSSGDGY